MSQAPYRCMSSAFAAYLSAGLTGVTLITPSGTLAACRIFGVSFEPTTVDALRVVVVNARTAESLRRVRVLLVDRRAEASARLFVALIAMTSSQLWCCQLLFLSSPRRRLMMNFNYQLHSDLVLSCIRLVLYRFARGQVEG